MGRIVVVAEKPSVGRDIARVLRCTQRGDGCLVGGEYTVTWALGHLVALQDPDELDEKYKKWRMEDLPILPKEIPLKVLPKTKSQYRIVKKLICDKETDRLICATDAGREGELIFRLIYLEAGCDKPVDRLWISSMTDEAIRDGFASLRPGGEYEGLYRSALCRAKADWLVGMNASRAFTLRYDALLSIGRVQTPTLNILVKRRREIEGFTPEEYYTLTADFGDYQGIWFSEGQENDVRIPKKETADAIAAAVKGRAGKVLLSESQDKQEPAPQLYDLTTLQRDANRLLGFTAQKTLKLAQSLYENYKYLTYPRTDSRYLTKDMAGRAAQAVRELPAPYQPYVPGAMPGGSLPFTKRIFDASKVTDHHAIIPTTKKADLDKLPPDERRLYDLVARRLLSAFYPPFRYTALKVITGVSEHRFRTTGRVVVNLGWKAVPPPETAKRKGAKGEAEDKPLPELKIGDERLVKDAEVKKESTKPPLPHTDGSLLYAMEHAEKELEDEALREQMKGSGLGTPATRAAVIERLVQVGYAQRKGKNLLATDKGMQLISIVPPEIASPETTGKWEMALEKIVTGGQDPERFLEGIRRLSVFLVGFAKDGKTGAVFAREESRGRKKSAVKPLNGVVCPVCGQGGVAENTKGFYCTRWKEGCAFTLWKDCLKRAGGPVLTAKLMELILKEKKVRGSTGVLLLTEDALTFTKKGERDACAAVPVIYHKKK